VEGDAAGHLQEAASDPIVERFGGNAEKGKS
jgi:hypothetical protein